MKQIKTLLATLSIIIVAISCKKDEAFTPAPSPSNAKLVKLTYAGTAYTQTFRYHANGRLENIKDNYFESRFTYPANAVTLEMFEGNSPYADFTNIVIANNRIASFGFRMFDNNGLPYEAEPTTLQYDAGGYMVKKSYSAYVYEYGIINGDITKLTITNTNSGAVRIANLEYYTDKPNNLNINVFEHWYLDQYMFDKDLFGKKSAHLPKKITDEDGVYELTYSMNAQNLPGQVIVKYTSITGASELSTINLTYQ